VIKSFKTKITEKVFEGEKPKKLKGLDFDLAVMRLDMLDNAISLQSLSPLKSIGLHPLKGGRQGQWAISVNSRWRICFEFVDGNAINVEITDYHKG